MSAKDKWKTYPCKECLIKTTCSTRCFDWPKTYDDRTYNMILLKMYIKINQLENICLSCGSTNVTKYNGTIQWACSDCRLNNKVII